MPVELVSESREAWSATVEQLTSVRSASPRVRPETARTTIITTPTAPPSPPTTQRFLTSPSTWPEASRLAAALRTETVGGLLLLAATVVALGWSNSPWREGYRATQQTTFGPSALHLRLDLSQWAADGLLAVFFLVAGLELKRELTVGDLRDPQRAVLPVVAALAGVAVPAVLYLAVTAGTPGAARGWAVPTATDIAFALAALAVMGSHLPSALRSFLLTLAVVDDLVAITIIAVFYPSDLSLPPLLAALAPLAAFAALAHSRWARWWTLLPLALATWGLVHASGVHATVAGVLLGFAIPVRPRHNQRDSLADRVEHAVRPFSAGFAVPAFAFMAAGVTLVGGGLSDAVRDRAAWGVVLALVVGKVVGVFGGTWFAARFTRAQLDDDLTWGDVLGLSLLAGIGFTVSLLIGELAFGNGSPRDEHVKAAVLMGSLVAAALAAVVLRRRERVYRRLSALESLDEDGDGIPDRYRPTMPTETPRRLDDQSEPAPLQERDMSEPHPTMSAQQAAGRERTLGQLVADASHDLSAIARNEIALVKAELKADLKAAVTGAALFLVAAVVAFVAVILLLIAAAYGLIALGLPAWAAFLIVAGVLLIVTLALALVGKARLSRAGPPERTLRTTKQTVETLKGVRSPTE